MAEKTGSGYLSDPAPAPVLSDPDTSSGSDRIRYNLGLDGIQNRIYLNGRIRIGNSVNFSG